MAKLQFFFHTAKLSRLSFLTKFPQLILWGIMLVSIGVRGTRSKKTATTKAMAVFVLSHNIICLGEKPDEQNAIELYSNC